MKKHIAQSDYDYKKVVEEVNNQPSLTVPDQSMSIIEIMKRFAKGLPIDGERVPWYEGTDQEIEENGDFPDITRLDQVDRHMLAKDAQENTARLRKKLREEAEQKKKADQGKKIERTSGEKADQRSTGAPDPNPDPGKNSAGGDEAKASDKK